MSASARHAQGGSRHFAVSPSPAKNTKHYRTIESSLLREGLSKCSSASLCRNGDSKLSDAGSGGAVPRLDDVAWVGTGIWSEQPEADHFFLATQFICLAVQYYFLHRAAVHDMNFIAVSIAAVPYRTVSHRTVQKLYRQSAMPIDRHVLHVTHFPSVELDKYGCPPLITSSHSLRFHFSDGRFV